jgi:hypothetical protein
MTQASHPNFWHPLTLKSPGFCIVRYIFLGILGSQTLDIA